MLGRAALSGRSQAHAYLMLLRVEVTAFHPAGLPSAMLDAIRCDRTGAGDTRPPDRLVSVALFLGLTPWHASALSGRLLAATLPCGVRTFLERMARGCLDHLASQHSSAIRGVGAGLVRVTLPD